MFSRRTFMRGAGVFAAAPFLQQGADHPFTAKKYDSSAFSLGVAGYTFHNYPVEASIAMMQQVGIDSLSVKDFHIPLNSEQAKIDQVMGQFRTAGIRVYAAGVIGIKTKQDADQAFAYATRLGVGMIVASPVYEQLHYIEGLVKQTGIKLAIHNHGPEDKEYPGPGDAFNRIKDLDTRIGLCLDIGHALRAGVDPVAAVNQYASRLFDMHMKDLSDTSSSEKAVEIGRGVIDFPGLIRALQKNGYKGICSIEFEKQVRDPLPGLAESAGYLRGVIKTLS